MNLIFNWKARNLTGQQSKMKMKIKKITPLILVVLLAGCTSSGPVPMGKDTFMITKQSPTGFHSGGSVKADIFREANEYCVSQGLQFQPISNKSKDGIVGFAFANAEVTFRCLADGDSEIKRPVPVPDVIIEKRFR